ncbi:MAG: hypothetical protein AAF664_07850 [Planctomycetota bacterium]
MWKLNERTPEASDAGTPSSGPTNGLGRWEDESGSIRFDLRGGQSHFLVSRQGFPELGLQLDGVETLPLADEQYVRDGRWYLNYPQTSLAHALRLQVKPQTCSFGSLLVVEICLVLQTDLLDTHPTVDLSITNVLIDRLTPKDWNLASPIAPPHRTDALEDGCSPVLVAKQNQSQTAILLDSHDAPFTTDLSDGGDLRIRLFGEFLEKGVIRKARPWIVFGNASQDELSLLHSQLQATPLPLTA